MGKACISRFCWLSFFTRFPSELIIFTGNVQQRYRGNIFNIVQCVNGTPATLVFLHAHLADSVYSALSNVSSGFQNLEENVCTYCYLCCSPHPATDNSKCGWVIYSQIALLVLCNTRSWHRREQLRTEVTHWGKDTSVLLILVLYKARPQWKIF